MEDTTSMKSWRLEVIGNCVQAEEYDSFIGGKPKLPPDIDIPKCELCGNELRSCIHKRLSSVWE